MPKRKASDSPTPSTSQVVCKRRTTQCVETPSSSDDDDDDDVIYQSQCPDFPQPGENGEPGERGPMGPPGLPGTVADEAFANIHGAIGAKGPPRPRGPPGHPGRDRLPGRDGFGEAGPMGPPGPEEEGAGEPGRPGPPCPAGQPGSPGSGSGGGSSGVGINLATSYSTGSTQVPVQVENETELQRLGGTIPVGTLAFTINTEGLYIRVSQGWRSITLGSDCIPLLAPSPPMEEAEVGIVDKVLLRNFMCHNRLEIRFGSNVNFVVGRNGSGKSAVLTAMVVGLGGTSRGTKLKSFIKTGKQSADVEITLRNRGTDAYKPELYGEKIIVNRHFNKDGSSLYKIKSKDGRVISQKKDDLCRILDKFNIQVDNPVTILNQDMSRNLLNTKSANDRYKFFIQAIQATPLHVGQTWKDYSMANEQKLVTMEMIERKMKPLPKLEKEVLSWEQKYKSLTAIDDLKGKIELLKKEMAWAFVIETEKAVIDKASQMHSDRINTRRSPTNLESQINQIIKQIHVEERQRGDPDEIAREYKEKRDSFFVIKKEVKQLKLLCERLDMVASKKLQQFKEFRRMVAVRAKYFFNIRLSNRQYSGKMTFNHQKETLDMNLLIYCCDLVMIFVVRPVEDQEESQTADSRGHPRRVPDPAGKRAAEAFNSSKIM